MERTWTLLDIGLAPALPLTAYIRDKAPDVAPTPSPVVTSQSGAIPENTPIVPNTTTPAPEGTEHPKDGGSTVRDTTRDTGDAAKDVTRGVGDAARGIINGASDTAKNIDDGVE